MLPLGDRFHIQVMSLLYALNQLSLAGVSS